MHRHNKPQWPATKDSFRQRQHGKYLLPHCRYMLSRHMQTSPAWCLQVSLELTWLTNPPGVDPMQRDKTGTASIG